MGFGRSKPVEQAAQAAQTSPKKRGRAKGSTNTGKASREAQSAPADPPQQYLAADGSITTDPGLNNRPEDRPKVSMPGRRLFDAGMPQSGMAENSALFSTHRAAIESTPRAIAQREQRVREARKAAEKQQNRAFEWLHSLFQR